MKRQRSLAWVLGGSLTVVFCTAGLAMWVAKEKGAELYHWESVEVIPFDSEELRAHTGGLQEELQSVSVTDLAVPGVPQGARQPFRQLKISGYVGPIDGVVATAVPSRQEIIVDVTEFVRLSTAERLQVLKHEAAHIALAQFFGHESIPSWFDEGFAEWASPDLTCVDRVRLRLELLRRSRKRLPWPSVRDSKARLSGRLHRDFLADFFRYVDRRKPGVIKSGDLLRAVKKSGLNAGFREAVGRDLDLLEADWVYEQTLETEETELLGACIQTVG